eukprot:TRINITY_DN26835_c0_g1_i1.p1 TRINITY_DN26835_c0_g1~~TRINITY_DN26835_c0_g1_i1.p1  ORF type:complete len:147 (+),score=23.45 TRINITY_DN26835_c0_g1_i1:87-527(+)
MLPGGDDNESVCPSLSFKQRIIGFGCCVAFGFLMSIFSWLAMFNRDYVQFGIFASLANIISLAGSCFLMGPMKQIKKMFEDKRLEATVILLVSMVWTLIAAFWLESPFVVIIMCLTQYFALIWYGLSYVPFARDVVKKCVKNLFGG